MALYLVSYDITQKNHDYHDLISRLETHRATKILYSEWLLTGAATTAEEARIEARSICDRLERAIEKGDRLLVHEVTRAASWTFGSLMISDALFNALVVANAREC